MAVVGTLLGGVVAVPLSFFAARTTSFVRLLSSGIKTLMNIFRATPIVVYAIILASMVGLGAQTGALAIAVGTFVMLTKLYAEALESISSGPVEAVRAAGGNTAQTFVFGMLPQVFPNYVSNTLYAFELNLQASFILGFVGAGGIGQDLLNYTRLFMWPKVGSILIITILVVNVVDFLSYRIRSAIS
jgi:phosphonate transport system permease protein